MHDKQAFNYIIFIAALFLLLIFSHAVYAQKQPVAQKGVIDLRNWQLIQDGNVKLDGEWEYYWGELLVPKDFQNDPNIIKRAKYTHIPGFLHQDPLKKGFLTPDGGATLRLFIKKQPIKELLLLSNSFHLSAYKIWVNGKLLGQLGTVSLQKEKHKPIIGLRDYFYASEKGLIEIVIQISDFSSFRSLNTIYLGLITNIHKDKTNRIVISTIILGILLIIALYHFLLFYLRRDQYAILTFAFLCLIVFIQILTESYAFYFLEKLALNYKFLFRISMVVDIIRIALLFTYLAFIFPKDFNKKLTLMIQGIAIVTTIIVISFPIKVGAYLLSVNQYIIMFYLIMLFYYLILAVIRKRRYSFLALFSLLVLVTAAINDILYMNGIISTTFLSSYTIVFYIFIQEYILAANFTDLMNKIELLSSRVTKQEVFKKFNATILHELKNSCFGIKAVINNIISKEKSLGKESLVGLNSITEQTGKLFDFSRNYLYLEMDNIEILKVNEVRLNLFELIAGAISANDYLVQSKKININNDIDPSVEISGDKNALHVLFNNLINNAVKYSYENGEVRIDLKENKIVIEDFGEGIDPEIKKKLFQDFEKGKTDEYYISTGLGLGICKRIVDLHGWRIEIDSELNIGTSLTILVK
ncbi:sensor histidine kinase [Candidatus Margulisiibacteriota bacterium]